MTVGSIFLNMNKADPYRPASIELSIWKYTAYAHHMTDMLGFAAYETSS